MFPVHAHMSSSQGDGEGAIIPLRKLGSEKLANASVGTQLASSGIRVGQPQPLALNTVLLHSVFCARKKYVFVTAEFTAPGGHIHMRM